MVRGYELESWEMEAPSLPSTNEGTDLYQYDSDMSFSPPQLH